MEGRRTLPPLVRPAAPNIVQVVRRPQPTVEAPRAAPRTLPTPQPTPPSLEHVESEPNSSSALDDVFEPRPHPRTHRGSSDPFEDPRMERMMIRRGESESSDEQPVRTPKAKDSTPVQKTIEETSEQPQSKSSSSRTTPKEDSRGPSPAPSDPRPEGSKPGSPHGSQPRTPPFEIPDNIKFPDKAEFTDIMAEEEKHHYEDIYVEQRRSFRRTRRAAFNQMVDLEKEDEEEQTALAGERRLRSVSYAIGFQQGMNVLSIVLQGFLSGLSVAHAVFAFNFADPDLLLKGYRWMSLPVHATFTVCFILGMMAAIDRVRWDAVRINQATAKELLKALGGFIQLAPMVLGLAASEMTIFFDENISNSNPKPSVTDLSLSSWRWLSAIRGLCALISWIAVAVQPANTALLEQIKMFREPEEVREVADNLQEVAAGEDTQEADGIRSKMKKAMKSRLNRLKHPNADVAKEPEQAAVPPQEQPVEAPEAAPPPPAEEPTPPSQQLIEEEEEAEERPEAPPAPPIPVVPVHVVAPRKRPIPAVPSTR